MDTKKLRQKILDLAIHGKLVPQDPNDEPASVLLERIRAEKEALIKEGKIKKSKKSASSDTPHYKNVPFDVPEGWCWATLPDLCIIPITDGTHQTPTYTTKDNGVPFISSKDVTSRVIDWSNIKYITKDLHLNLYKRIAPQRYDILLAKNGTTGVAAMVEDDRVFDIYVTLAVIRPSINNVVPEYLLNVINSEFCKRQFNSHLTGIGLPNLHLTDINKTLIPLPPYKEQLKIISKLSEVLKVVDAIKDNSGSVFDSIKSAKSKILDLAIHGKLVPQDPTDEPASELLKRINPKAVASCDNPHYTEPYELPHGWKWVELGKLAVDSADGPFGSNLKKEHYTINKEVRIIQLSNIGEEGWKDENTKYTTFEHLSAISRSEVKSGDIVIAKMMPAGRAILCPNSDVKYVLSSDAVKFVIPEGICNEYILNSINSSVFREQVYGNVQGVTRVRTSLQKLRTYVLPIPPIKEQLRIVAKVKELFSQLDMIEESLQA